MVVGEKMRDLDCAAERLGIKKKSIQDDYVLGKKIGEGASAIVKECRRKDMVYEKDIVVKACKTISKSKIEGRFDMLYEEIEIMKHLRGHPGIVALEDVYEDSDSIHLVMELASGGNLSGEVAKVKKLPHSEEHCARRIKELMVILNYCHDMGVVHRDIKLENILLTEKGEMKLADFGLATKIIKGQSLTNIVGSPRFLAPEVIEGNYSEKVDIWSSGIVLHRALVGFFPFVGKSAVDVLEAVITTKLSFTGKTWEPVSEAARDLLGRMLQRDASLRLSAAEVLNHPWIKLHSEKTSESKKHTVHPSSRSSSLSSKCRTLFSGGFSCFSNSRCEDVRFKQQPKHWVLTEGCA